MPAGRYEAESPSLFGNPGGQMAPRYNVDVPGAINALANGTSSLIHNIYARKMAQRQQEIESQRYNEQAQWHADQVQRERERDAIDERRWTSTQHLNELKAGVTPATTTTSVTSGDENPVALTPMTQAAATGTPAGASPIAAAMGAPPAPTTFDPTGRTASPLPPLAQTERPAPAGPSTYLAPQPTPTTVTTPESYDPTKSEAYLQHLATAEVMGSARRDAAQTSADARRYAAEQNLEGRRVMAGAAKYAADKRAASGRIGGALTGNALEQKFERVDAPGILSANDWDLSKAIDQLNNTPEGQAAKKAGLTTNHLSAAYEKHVQGRMTQATRLQSGATGMTPEESTGAVETTDKLVRRAARGAGGTPPASAEPTDEELRAAMAAGVKSTDAAGARAWVKKHRQGTK